MSGLAPIFRSLQPVRRSGRGPTPQSHAVSAGTVFLASEPTSTVRLVQHGCAAVYGASARRWGFAHDRAGAPMLLRDDGEPLSISVAATHGTRALLLGAGPLGIDIETVDRVAANASGDDDWLAPGERTLLAGLPPRERTVELACRWVLREAYGKASGRGLDYPLARLAFTVRAGVVTPHGQASSDDGWAFSLHRRGDLVIGIVAAGSAG